MTTTIHEPSPQDTPPPAFPGSDPAELAALARMFSEHLSPVSMRRLGKYEPAFTRMALTLMDATWAASRP